MKILFKGLGPRDTVSYEGKTFYNGSVVTMPEGFAKAYIETGLAIEIKTAEDEAEVAATQKLEEKNAARRKAITEKVAAGKGDKSDGI